MLPVYAPAAASVRPLRGLQLFPWYFYPCARKAPAAALSARLRVPAAAAGAGAGSGSPAAAHGCPFRIAPGISCSGYQLRGLPDRLQLPALVPVRRKAPAAAFSAGFRCIARPVPAAPGAGSGSPAAARLVHLVPAARPDRCRYQLQRAKPEQFPRTVCINVRLFGLFAAVFFAAAARIASGLVKITRTITNFPPLPVPAAAGAGSWFRVACSCRPGSPGTSCRPSGSRREPGSPVRRKARCSCAGSLVKSPPISAPANLPIAAPVPCQPRPLRI